MDPLASVMASRYSRSLLLTAWMTVPRPTRWSTRLDVTATEAGDLDLGADLLVGGIQAGLESRDPNGQLDAIGSRFSTVVFTGVAPKV